jgi:hypothetical protein
MAAALLCVSLRCWNLRDDLRGQLGLCQQIIRLESTEHVDRFTELNYVYNPEPSLAFIEHANMPVLASKMN